MMNNEKYLPIGTVVRLKDGKKNLMITGFCVTSPEVPDQVMDYNGCFYPEGIVDSTINFLFNHEEIEEIHFIGYSNEEEKEFKIKLNEIMNDVQDPSINSQNNIAANINNTPVQPQTNVNVNTQPNPVKFNDIPIIAQQQNNNIQN